MGSTVFLCCFDIIVSFWLSPKKNIKLIIPGDLPNCAAFSSRTELWNPKWWNITCRCVITAFLIHIQRAMLGACVLCVILLTGGIIHSPDLLHCSSCTMRWLLRHITSAADISEQWLPSFLPDGTSCVFLSNNSKASSNCYTTVGENSLKWNSSNFRGFA